MILWQVGASMLKQRIITALIMAGVFLAAIVFLPLSGLALLFGIFVCMGGWEWSRLAGWSSPVARALYVAVLAAALAGLYAYCHLGSAPSQEQVQPFLGVACLWWSFALLWVKGYPASAALWRTVAMRSVMGLLILAPAWMSAVFLLSFPRGGALMVVMVVVVAAADIGAYFSGKAFGKHKLAVLVSPAKTWEGFWGGMLVSVLLAVLLWYLLPDQAAHIGLASVVAVTLTTALASVVGDLTVSMVKRESGVKDSGSLLPGHGGVLDRLDSLCGAAPVFALGLLLAGW
jgi:phosphatidate cytidylyltransferase